MAMSCANWDTGIAVRLTDRLTAGGQGDDAGTIEQ
jgi:hypothetical protein